MNEHDALFTARTHTLQAMSALELFPDGSYVADEAYGLLERALRALVSGVRYFEMESEDPMHLEPLEGPGDPQGEGEGLSNPLLDTSPEKWLAQDWPPPAFL